MRTQEYILLIMNCEKYRAKAEEQKRGWIQQLPAELIYYHVIGNENMEQEYNIDEENRTLYVRTPDDYNSLPYKVISAYAAINSEFDYRYIFKTDDDQHLTEPKMLNIWMNMIRIRKPNYAGKVVTVHNDHISEYYYYHPELPRNVLVRRSQYCNGRFYVLSRIAVKDLLLKKSLFLSEYFEDYAVGYYMDQEIKSNFMPLNNDVFVDNLNLN